MELGIVLGTLIMFALILAIGGGFVAARFLSHAAQHGTRGAHPRDR